MTEQHPFKWRHYEPVIISLCPLISAGALCHASLYPVEDEKNWQELLRANG